MGGSNDIAISFHTQGVIRIIAFAGVNLIFYIRFFCIISGEPLKRERHSPHCKAAPPPRRGIVEFIPPLRGDSGECTFLFFCFITFYLLIYFQYRYIIGETSTKRRNHEHLSPLFKFTEDDQYTGR